MTKIYSTQDLIKILAEERQACLKGERLNLAANPSTGNPIIDKFLNPDGVQKFSAYQDFKAAVHRYQIEHQVSGIVWRQVTLKGETMQIPQVDEGLIALSNDLKTLKAAKAEILGFWNLVTVGMELYLSVNNAKDHRQIWPDDVEAIALRTEWATLWKSEKSDFLEIVLQLGWGKVEEAAYRRGWPANGSEYVHAVNPGKRPIC